RRRFLARGLGAPGLAAASLAGALRRSAVLTVAVATAIGVMLGVAIMVGSFRETVSQWLCEQLQNDVFVRAADWDRSHPVPLPAGVLAAAAATPGAAAVAASCTQLWSFRGQPIVLNTRWPLTGSAAMPRYRFLAGGAGPVIVSEPFARRFHLGPGSRLELDAPQGSLHLAISGVIFDYTTDRGIVTLDRATFERGFGAPRATEIGLDAAQGVSAAQLQRNFAERAAGSGGPVRGLAINENAALRAQALRVFDQTFRITYALEVITLLVAILGVGNTLLAVVLERAPEFAVLRFLGATRSQIRRLLLAEAGVVASLALAVGWGMGLVLAVILARVINVQSFGWSIQSTFRGCFWQRHRPRYGPPRWQRAGCRRGPRGRKPRPLRWRRCNADGGAAVPAARGPRLSHCHSRISLVLSRRRLRAPEFCRRVVVLHRQSPRQRWTAVRLRADVLPHRPRAEHTARKAALFHAFHRHRCCQAAIPVSHPGASRQLAASRRRPRRAGHSPLERKLAGRLRRIRSTPPPRRLGWPVARSRARSGPTRAPWHERLVAKGRCAGRGFVLLLIPARPSPRFTRFRQRQRAGLDGPRVRHRPARSRSAGLGLDGTAPAPGRSHALQPAPDQRRARSALGRHLARGLRRNRGACALRLHDEAGGLVAEVSGALEGDGAAPRLGIHRERRCGRPGGARSG